MEGAIATRGRWRPFPVAMLFAQMLAFALGVAVATSIAVALSPATEELGRLGLGLLLAVALAVTPLVFIIGFMAAEAARPLSSGWRRAARSLICGSLYVCGWLILARLLESITGLWEVAEWLSASVLLTWWLVGPPLLAVAVWRVWRGDRAAVDRGGAA